MTPDIDTQVLARLHPEPNGRGLNVYNPYFERVGINATYLLFHGADPKPLLDGVRALGISGAVVAGSFEKDPRLPSLLDDVHPISQALGTVGVVVNRGGRLEGVYQGGYGLHDSITSTFGGLQGRRVVLLGAGNVAKALLLVLKESGDIPDDVTIYNRTVGRAEALASDFSFISRVGTLDDFLRDGEGDVLVNVSKLGSASAKEPAMEFSEGVVARFEDIADVVFQPLDPPLARLARAAGRRFAPGYRMFMLQARYVLRYTLGHEMDQDIYERIMIDDFEKNW